MKNIARTSTVDRLTGFTLDLNDEDNAWVVADGEHGRAEFPLGQEWEALIMFAKFIENIVDDETPGAEVFRADAAQARANAAAIEKED